MHDERTSAAAATRRQQQQRRRCVVVQSQIARLEAEIHGQFWQCIADEQRQHGVVDVNDEEVHHRLLVDRLARLVELVVEWRCANERVASKQQEIDEDGQRVALFWSFGRQIVGYCAEQSQCEERIKLCEQLDRLLQLCFNDGDSANFDNPDETETERTYRRGGLRGECAFRSCVTLVGTSRGAETHSARTLATADSRCDTAERATAADDDNNNGQSVNKCYFEFDDDELDSWCFETAPDETEEILYATYWRAVSRFACGNGARTTTDAGGAAETGTLHRRRARHSSAIGRAGEPTLRVDANDETHRTTGSADLPSDVWSYGVSNETSLSTANGGTSQQQEIDYQRAIQRFAQFCARTRSYRSAAARTSVCRRYRTRLLGRNTKASVAQSRRTGKVCCNRLRKELCKTAPLQTSLRSISDDIS